MLAVTGQYLSINFLGEAIHAVTRQHSRLMNGTTGPHSYAIQPPLPDTPDTCSRVLGVSLSDCSIKHMLAEVPDDHSVDGSMHLTAVAHHVQHLFLCIVYYLSSRVDTALTILTCAAGCWRSAHQMAPSSACWPRCLMTTPWTVPCASLKLKQSPHC